MNVLADTAFDEHLGPVLKPIESAPRKKVSVRAATAEDIAAFSDMAGKPTVKAWCGTLDGKIIAIGGLARIKGRYYAFCDLTEDARPFRMTLMRTAKRMMAEAKRMGIRYVYAEADTTQPSAIPWLKSLGFALDPRSQFLYRWDSKNQWLR